MKIGFDASVLRGRFTGVEYYTLRLLEALRAADAEVVAFSDRPVPQAADVHVIGPRLPLPLWRQVVLPRAVQAAGLQSFHSPVTAIPLRLPVPTVATVYDLGYIRWPGCYGPLARRAQRFWLGRAVRRAAGIVCISDATRQAVTALYPEAAARLHTVHNGAVALPPAPALPESRRRASIERLGVPTPFALVAGRIEKRKNPVTTLHAFLAATAAPPWDTTTLVFAGAPGNAYAELTEALRVTGCAARVRLCQYLQPGDLACLYDAAEILLYFSLDEGFGHPPLEALSVGTPVAAADIPVLREVLADAAEFAPPEDVPAMAAAIRRVLDSPERRNALLLAGARRVQLFTWEKTAAAVAALHAELAGAGCDANVAGRQPGLSTRGQDEGANRAGPS
jgi:glycosyltransferase involved in cell wall biosynthesis